MVLGVPILKHFRVGLDFGVIVERKKKSYSRLVVVD